tara:strand:- start:348 stop:482 length:135 start_codon:yes stop_codon:yes gene_type:complete
MVVQVVVLHLTPRMVGLLEMVILLLQVLLKEILEAWGHPFLQHT